MRTISDENDIMEKNDFKKEKEKVEASLTEIKEYQTIRAFQNKNPNDLLIHP